MLLLTQSAMPSTLAEKYSLAKTQYVPHKRIFCQLKKEQKEHLRHLTIVEGNAIRSVNVPA